MPRHEVTTVVMVRHADVHNPTNIIYGRLPRFRLSEIGRRQVTGLAEGIRHLQAHAVYSSPQLRARQTAQALAENLYCSTIQLSSLISEVRTSYQGQSNAVLGNHINFYDHPAAPEDESIAMVARRMARFLERVRRRHQGQTVIAVSHADPIMILRATTLGLPLVIKSIQGKYYPAKCSLMQFSFMPGEERPIVVYRELIKDETIPAGTRNPKNQTKPEAEQNGHKHSAWLPKSAKS